VDGLQGQFERDGKDMMRAFIGNACPNTRPSAGHLYMYSREQNLNNPIYSDGEGLYSHQTVPT